MARGINKVILVGNLGADPETRFTASGAAVTNLRLATSEVWRDKQTGEQNERTEWHRIVMFNKLAEVAGEFLHKGSQVYIEGKLQTRKWQDPSGQDRYSTEIVASEFQMLGGRSNMQQGGGQYDENRGNRGQYGNNQGGGYGGGGNQYGNNQGGGYQGGGNQYGNNQGGGYQGGGYQGGNNQSGGYQGGGGNYGGGNQGGGNYGGGNNYSGGNQSSGNQSGGNYGSSNYGGGNSSGGGQRGYGNNSGNNYGNQSQNASSGNEKESSSSTESVSGNTASKETDDFSDDDIPF